MFDGVEVGRVWRQVKKGVSSILNGLFHLSSFVEAGVIHDHDAVWRKLGHQVLNDPSVEDLSVDCALEQTDGEQGFAEECTHDIRPPFRSPVVLSNTSFSTYRITMSPR